MRSLAARRASIRSSDSAFCATPLPSARPFAAGRPDARAGGISSFVGHAETRSAQALVDVMRQLQREEMAPESPVEGEITELEPND